MWVDSAALNSKDTTWDGTVLIPMTSEIPSQACSKWTSKTSIEYIHHH
ncbi:unnamed protein product, partial [Rotaria magnacalcarata]